MSVRVRFAPSPTGYLHVGGARTALFNWLFARNRGGAFILRIEDTDLERSREEMTAAILDGMRWLGLSWDEGPFFQSQRREIHRAAARALLESGAAYPCFCDPAELQERRTKAEKEGLAWKYDGACRGLDAEEVRARQAAGKTWCTRFRVPTGVTSWEDRVHGRTAFANDTLEDFVLARSDESPTYHLSVVADDIDMGITDIIRGDDHLSNTPKQILLYGALGKAPPAFAHLPLLLGPDKKRLSKRHGAVAVTEYRDAGILPEALFNFLALLGWSPGDDREVLPREELVRLCSFDGVGTKGAVFDEQKLEWLNGQYIVARAASALREEIRPELERRGLWDPSLEGARKEWFERVLDALKERARRMGDLVRGSEVFLGDRIEYHTDAVAKHLQEPETAARLLAGREALAAAHSADDPGTEQALRQAA